MLNRLDLTQKMDIVCCTAQNQQNRMAELLCLTYGHSVIHNQKQCLWLYGMEAKIPTIKKSGYIIIIMLLFQP